MNLIVLVLDSFRQDHVSLYHAGTGPFPDVPACPTPNIDRFAESCVVFDNAYPEAAPTIPIRRQLMTGQATLPYVGWQGLAAAEVTAAEILAPSGYTSGLVTDTHPFFDPGMNYHRGFHSHQWIRGQQYDMYHSHKSRRSVDDYANENYTEAWRRRVHQCLVNTDDQQDEADYFPNKVVARSVDWLEANRSRKKGFFWMDCFDPHEPWDPPARFDTFGDAGYSGPRLIMPMGGQASSWATDEQIRHMRSLYAGEAAFVDDCLGTLFQALESLGYFEDSVILLMGDHGHPLADHGKFLKGPDRMYSELFKVPFMIRLPGGEHAGRRKAIVQFHDVLPTLFELIGLGDAGEAMAGRSFAEVVRGDRDEFRPAMISGYHGAEDRCVRDERWSYVYRPGNEPDELYDLVEDPRETKNLIDDAPDEAHRLRAAFGPIYYHRRRHPLQF